MEIRLEVGLLEASQVASGEHPRLVSQRRHQFIDKEDEELGAHDLEDSPVGTVRFWTAEAVNSELALFYGLVHTGNKRKQGLKGEDKVVLEC